MQRLDESPMSGLLLGSVQTMVHFTDLMLASASALALARPSQKCPIDFPHSDLSIKCVNILCFTLTFGPECRFVSSLASSHQV